MMLKKCQKCNQIKSHSYTGRYCRDCMDRIRATEETTSIGTGFYSTGQVYGKTPQDMTDTGPDAFSTPAPEVYSGNGGEYGGGGGSSGDF